MTVKPRYTGRAQNRRKLLTGLKDYGIATRAELNVKTGLARSTVSALLEELAAAGLVEELSEAPGRPDPGIGRPVERYYQLKGESAYAVGIDVGHERISVALANLGQKILLAGSCRSLEHARDFRAAQATIVHLVQRLIDESGIDARRVVAAGVGIPGAIDSDGRMRLLAVLPGWTHLTPRDDLLETLQAVLPAVDRVTLDNDANHGALGEKVRGALRHVDHGLYVRASRGIGAGVIVDGQINRGAGGFAGELGHTPLPSTDGAFCRICGRRCLEASASSNAVLRMLRHSFEDLDHDELIAAANRRDAACEGALHDAGSRVGLVVGSFCNLLNPAKLVVGGQLSDAAAFMDGVRRGMAEAALEPVFEQMEIVSSELRHQYVPGFDGEEYRVNAELVGAISHAFEQVDVHTTLEAAGIDALAALH